MDVQIKHQGTFCGDTLTQAQQCPAPVQMARWVWQSENVEQVGVAGAWLIWVTAGPYGWVR